MRNPSLIPSLTAFSVRFCKKDIAGFSLAEVSIALGLMSFCLVGLLGLLPQGLKQERRSTDQLQALEVLTAVAADFRVQVAGATTNNTLFRTELPKTGLKVDSILVTEGGQVTLAADQAAFKVLREIKSPASAFDSYQMHISVSRSAGAEAVTQFNQLAGRDFAEAVISTEAL